MNELIKKFHNQAIEELDPNTVVGSFSEAVVQRVAELIVRECIGCCEQVISDPVPKSVDTWLNGGSQCIDEIKQHFGVT
jgi:hypothetical protein